MNTKFYLLRHGESKFNYEKRHQGWMEENPLTSNGLKQVEKISNKIANLSIDIIYSSPLLRTKQTAKIISEKIDKRVLYSKNLLDFRRSKSQEGFMVQEYSVLPEFKTWIKNSNSNPNYSLPDGESKSSFSKRVNKFALYCNHKYANKNILIVSHMDVIWQLVRHWIDIKIDKDKISNCTIIKIKPDKKYMTYVE